MHRHIKSIISKVNFALNRVPRIEKETNYSNFIPKSFKSVLTITADFELAWAWRYSKDFKDPYSTAVNKSKVERANTLKLIELCDRYNIPVTWATVGHLFLDKCDKEGGIPHPDIPRLGNFVNRFWEFSGNDWFEHDPCSNHIDAPEWYCPDLIDAIIGAKTQHEIGCHTFSHIDCTDEICPKEVFDAEIGICKWLARERGVELTSFVHPGHTIGNLDNLALQGFTSFQTDPGNILGYPVKHTNGLWELKRTYELGFRSDWSVDYHKFRYKRIIERAIKSNTVCNFWFHPSFDERFLDEVVPDLFAYIESKRDEILVSTVSNYIEMVENGI